MAHKVLVSQPVDLKKESYLGIVFDRKQACPVLIAAPRRPDLSGTPL